MQKMKLSDYLKNVHTVAIAGHVNPDGDCIGSCMGTCLYIRDHHPDIQVDVYMEKPRSEFGYIDEINTIHTVYNGKDYDLLILLDISSKDRIGVAERAIKHAKEVLVFDHHKTNTGGYTYFYNDPEASSASEVVCRFMDMEKISKRCAECLYTGIAHDTGIFQYSSCSSATMRMAADLMDKGIEASRIIDESYFQKTYAQNKVLGRVVAESERYLSGKFIMGCADFKLMKECGAVSRDMNGIAEKMRTTIGVEVSCLLYQTAPETFKASLRSKDKADVSVVMSVFGGGGHAKAAGATMNGSMEECKARILEEVEKQLIKQGLL